MFIGWIEWLVVLILWIIGVMERCMEGKDIRGVGFVYSRVDIFVFFYFFVVVVIIFLFFVFMGKEWRGEVEFFLMVGVVDEVWI